MKWFHTLNRYVFASVFIYLIQLTPIHSYVVNCTKLHSYEDYESDISSSVDSNTVNHPEVVFRVLNGEPAALGELPYQIALMGQSKKIYPKWVAVCGGSIISDKKVLTAAHCVKQRKISDCNVGRCSSVDLRHLRVVAGQLKSYLSYHSDGQWRTIKYARYPLKYKFPKHDIAVLYLRKPFQFNDAVQPIQFASKKIDYGGIDCLASGYGRINAKQQSPVLLKAYITVLPMDVCNSVHQEDFSTFVCTSDFVSDLHKGDSGGPLVCKNTTDPAEKGSKRGILVGIVSGKDIQRRMSTFFTRVSYYHRYINLSSKIEASPCVFLSFNLIIIIYYLTSQF